MLTNNSTSSNEEPSASSIQAFTRLHTKLENYYNLPKGQGLEMIPYMDRLNPLLVSDKRISRLECLQMVNRDFHRVLSVDDHDFWMYMLNDVSLKRCIESIFRLFPRPFDIGFNSLIHDTTITPKSEQREEAKIYRRLFMIYYKLFMNFYLSARANSNELRSPQQLRDQVDPEEWLDIGSVISQKSLFDIPKLFDLSALYAYSNTMLTTELLTKIFLSQPSLMHDLNDHVLNTICINWRDLFDNIYKMQPINGATKPQNSSSSESNQIRKIIYYLYDGTFTIRSLLDVFPLASYAFMLDNREKKTPMSYQFSFLILECHDKVIPQLQSMIGEDTDYSFLCKQIKLNLLSITHVLFREYYMRNIEDLVTGATHTNRSTSSHMDALHSRYIENLLTREQIPQAKLELLCKYTLDKQMTRQTTAIVLELLDTLQSYQKFIITDQPKLNYLMFQYDKLYGLSKWMEQVIANNSSLTSVSSVQNLVKNICSKLSEAENEAALQGSEEKPTSDAQQQLKSLFPDYGLGFLQLCLEHFKNDLAVTTNSLMDNQLPLQLRRLDTKLTLSALKSSTIQAQSSSEFNKPPSSLISAASASSGRHSEPPSPVVSPSVWMDTDFFSNASATSQVVRIGKKKDHGTRTNFNDIDDSIKQRILLEYAYDDEYDDSYDSIAPVTGEGEHEDENFNKLKTSFKQQHESASEQHARHKHKHEGTSEESQYPQFNPNRAAATSLPDNNTAQATSHKPRNQEARSKQQQQQPSQKDKPANTNQQQKASEATPPQRGGSANRGGKSSRGFHHQGAASSRPPSQGKPPQGSSNQESTTTVVGASSQIDNTTTSSLPSDSSSEDHQQQPSERYKQYKQENKSRIANHDRKKKGAKKRMNL
ncbi:hypothetical protein C9374_011429 [Naegleria lovaniensis]|uniref:CUE domain-containing protein n=1 Tax=Naegleria lovaniensis TaxID=51637 RepID=A0AA88H2Z8_NAELO|nr:uncharacterized protein C9374_011429 [Naegleria lovaniensis]KAG2392704.1 hypothetical protein C9374_011429 [Naegleria lovaniensis]